MIRRLATVGIVSAALGATMLAAPPTMAAESAEYGTAVSAAANRPEVGHGDRRGKRRHCRRAHRRHCKHRHRHRHRRHVRHIHIHIHNKNLSYNKNQNKNRDRDHDRGWDWDWDR